MLVLTRKLNQEIIIGDDIRIVVVGINGGDIKLGIEAPIEIPVHRKEVYQRIHSTEPKDDKNSSDSKHI